jgi:hypothetical protein
MVMITPETANTIMSIMAAFAAGSAIAGLCSLYCSYIFSADEELCCNIASTLLVTASVAFCSTWRNTSEP